MTTLYMYIPGLGNEILLTRSADCIPEIGDRIDMAATRLDKHSHEILESVPACRCFAGNQVPGKLTLGVYLKVGKVTVTGRNWVYRDGICCCTLDVEVR